MSRATRHIVIAVASACGMYWFDPEHGRRRRARLRERLYSAAAGIEDGLEVTARDLSHRLRGSGAALRGLASPDEPDDTVLVERVRSKIGRVVAHPGAVTVSAADGHVRLSGHVLASEHAALRRAVRRVHGVKAIEDQLAVHKSATGVSALQGGQPRHPVPFELLQENWSPSARVLAGIAGAAVAAHGARGGGPVGLTALIAGGALLLRSITNLPLRRLAGTDSRHTIDVHKSIRVHAPVERVFQTLESYESFPSFMRNVRSVRDHGDGRSHWVVAGPAGISVEWDAVTTRHEPNRVLAWRTVPHAIVDHEGTIRLEPLGGGEGTRLDIELSYSPPAGALGHVVAWLFGADPKTELDEDMLRLKSFLETGKRAHDAAGNSKHRAEHAARH
jgi:uncharacterized membrane protein